MRYTNATSGPGSMVLRRLKKRYPKVSMVIDARSPIRIQVTKRDQQDSGRRNHESCAMAEACKRKLNLDGVVVARSTVYLVKGKKATRFLLGEHESREIVSFDRGGEFATGEYKLRAPDAWNRLGGKGTGGHNKENEGSGRKKQEKHYTKNIRAILGKLRG